MIYRVTTPNLHTGFSLLTRQDHCYSVAGAKGFLW